MSRSLTHPQLPLTGKRHPLTGQPLRVLGYRKDGRPICPIMGGDDTVVPAERPEDVPQETWDALGDPGKVALTRERSARQEAEKARDTAVRERDAARARPAPPKTETVTPPPGTKTDDNVDVAAIVKQAVEAAIKPFADRESQREVEAAAAKVRDVVLEAAKPLLHDPSDALANVDLAALVDDQGRADAEKVTAALAKVVETKPHLAKTTTRVAPLGIGGGAPTGTGNEADRVKALLAQMQGHAGVRVPASS